MAVELATAYISVLPSTSKLAAGIKSELNTVDKHAATVGDKAGKSLGSRMASGVKSLVGPAIGAMAGIGAVNFFKDAFAEAQEAQKVGAQTAAVIKSTGGAANVTAKHVSDLAGALSAKTGIDDEQIQSSQNMLLTFTNIRNEAGENNKIFDLATRAVTDMSVALGQDGKSSAIQLGKALNDPVKGMSALQRVGVAFTDKQKKMVEGWVEHGQTLKAQKFILGEIQKEFGGSAAAQATAADKAKVAWGNLKETVGTALMPVFTKVATVVADKIIPAVSRFIEQIKSGKGAGGQFADAVRTAWGVLKGLGATVLNVAGWLNRNKGAIAAVAAVIGTLMLPAMVRLGVQATVARAKLVGAWLSAQAGAIRAGVVYAAQSAKIVAQWALMAGRAVASGARMAVAWTIGVIGPAGRAIARMVVASAAFVARWVLMGAQALIQAARVAAAWLIAMGPVGLIIAAVVGLVAIIIKNWDKIKQGIAAAWNWVKAKTKAFWTWIKTVISGAVNKAKDLIGKAWSWIKDKTKAVWDGIKTYFKTVFTFYKTIITTAVKKIREWIAAAWQWIKDKTKAVWDGIKAYFKNIFDFYKNLISGALGKIKEWIGNAWAWVKDKTKAVWDGIKSFFTTAWDKIKTTFTNAIDKAKSLVSNAWTWIKDKTKSVWDGIKSFFSNLWTKIKDSFKNAIESIGNIWNKLKALAAKPVNFLIQTVYNNGLRKMLNLLPGVDLAPANPVKFAAGGPVRGGRRRRDSVPALMMPGEHVLTTDEVRKAGGHKVIYRLRQLLASGALDRGSLRHGGDLGADAPRFATGGALSPEAIARAQTWARRQAGKPYIWGGVGPGGFDCSGFISGVQNVIRGGDGYGTRYGTSSTFPWAGYKPGWGQFTVGAFTGSPGHVAGTLAGLNVESTDGSVRVGSRARGASNPMFTRLGHLGAGGKAAAEQGGFFAIIGTIKDLIGKLKDWVGQLARMGGWAGMIRKVVSGIWDRIAGWINDKIPFANPVPASVFDRGGVLRPGQVAFNASRRPEAVLTRPQLHALLEQTSPAGRGRRMEVVITNWRTGRGYMTEIAEDTVAGREAFAGTTARMRRAA